VDESEVRRAQPVTPSGTPVIRRAQPVQPSDDDDEDF
jgi:hypothetical protein